MTSRCLALAVTGGGSVGKCGRLNQPSWLLVRTIISNCHTYLGLLMQDVLTAWPAISFTATMETLWLFYYVMRCIASISRRKNVWHYTLMWYVAGEASFFYFNAFHCSVQRAAFQLSYFLSIFTARRSAARCIGDCISVCLCVRPSVSYKPVLMSSALAGRTVYLFSFWQYKVYRHAQWLFLVSETAACFRGDVLT